MAETERSRDCGSGLAVAMVTAPKALSGCSPAASRMFAVIAASRRTRPVNEEAAAAATMEGEDVEDRGSVLPAARCCRVDRASRHARRPI